VVVRTNEYLPPSVLAGLIEFNSGGDRGRFQDQLELMFEDSRTGIRFAIVKPLMCIVGDDEDYELLCPIAPYVPKARVQREPVNEYVLGERPRVLSSMEWKVPLEEYKIPVPLRRALELTRERERLQTIRDQYMPRTFDASTHSFHFSRLLHVEEHQSE
jgi:helicase MOV-10